MTDIVEPGHPRVGELSLPGTTLLAKTEVTALATTATLAALLTTASAAIHADVRRVTLIPASSGVYWSASGAAAATGVPLPTGSNEIECRAAEASDMQFIVASGTIAMTIVQEG